MRKPFLMPKLTVLIVSAFLGCSAADKTEETNHSSAQGGAAQAGPQSEGKQYRAVCIEKDQHGGNEYVLSKWFDSAEKADEIGKYHGDFKYKGHRWRIDERVKSEAPQPYRKKP